MKSIHDKFVFEHDGEVILARKVGHIELTAPGFFARIDRPFSQSVVRLVAVQEQARYDTSETQAVVRYGHDELLRFESQEEASLFVSRLQREIQDLLGERDNAFAGSSSTLLGAALSFERRLVEWLGVIGTGVAIAFTGAVLAYPGWKLGEHLFRDLVQQSSSLAYQEELLRKELNSRSLAIPVGEASLVPALARIESTGHIRSGEVDKDQELQKKLVDAVSKEKQLQAISGQ